MKPEEGYDHTWILKPTASQSLNTIEDFQNSERRAEEENKLSDGSMKVCSIASFDYFEKKHKARDGAELPVVKLEVEQRKVSRPEAILHHQQLKGYDFPAQNASVELPVVKQEVEKRKVIRIKPTHQRVRDVAAELPVGEEGEKPKNKRQLRTNDWGTIVSMVGQMRTEVSDTAAAAHLEVSEAVGKHRRIERENCIEWKEVQLLLAASSLVSMVLVIPDFGTQ
nr:uncharacterized protein LOC109191526 [Ipomoea batatas]